MPLDPMIARGTEAPDLTRPLLLAEEIKNRRQTNQLYAMQQQFTQQKYADEQAQQQEAAQLAQTQAAEKEEASGLYHAAVQGNPMAKNLILKKISEKQPGIFQGIDVETAWKQIEPHMRQSLGVDAPEQAPGPLTAQRLDGGATAYMQDGKVIPGGLKMPEAPQQYAPESFQPFTQQDGSVVLLGSRGTQRPTQLKGQLKGAGAAGGVTVNEDGTLTVNPDPSKATEGERTATNYADRMEAAEGKLGTYVPSTKDYAASSVVMTRGPVIASAANKALSKEGQLYYQAAADWVRAKLRKESGAVIAPQEMEQEIKTYFPLPGDNDETVAQKTQARQQASAGMRQMGGRGASSLPERPGQSAPTANKRVKFGDIP
jgi:hypothetical protein